MKKLSIVFLMLLFCVVALVPNSEATIWTVASDADFTAALGGAVAGDTVNVSAGTYSRAGTEVRTTPAYNPTNSGSAVGGYITFKAIGVVNLRLSSGTGPVLGAYSRSYIVWDGFRVTLDYTHYDGENHMGVAWDSDHITIKNCTLVGTTIDHGNYSAIRTESSSYITIQNNDLSGIHGNDAGNCAGILTYSTPNLTINNNTIHDCDQGIFIKGPTAGGNTGVIYKNLIYDVSLGLYISEIGEAGITIYQNIIYDAGTGIYVHVLASGPRNTKVVNNTFVGFSYLFYQYTATLTGNAIHNNIFADLSSGAAYGGLYRSGYTNDGSLTAEHNVYYNHSPEFRIMSTSDYTLAQWKTAFHHEEATPASITSNPLFANVLVNDYRLCTAAGAPHASCTGASPAIALGVDILDLDGDGSTSDTIPAGAYITGNETIGVESTEAETSQTISGGVTLSGASLQ